MSREEQLQKQLDDYRKAKRSILDRLDECMQLPDNRTRSMWHKVAPILKSAIEGKIERGAEYNQRDLERIVFEKAMEAVCGDEWKQQLECL